MGTAWTVLATYVASRLIMEIYYVAYKGLLTYLLRPHDPPSSAWALLRVSGF